MYLQRTAGDIEGVREACYGTHRYRLEKTAGDSPGREKMTRSCPGNPGEPDYVIKAMPPRREEKAYTRPAPPPAAIEDEQTQLSILGRDTHRGALEALMETAVDSGIIGGQQVASETLSAKRRRDLKNLLYMPGQHPKARKIIAPRLHRD